MVVRPATPGPLAARHGPIAHRKLSLDAGAIVCNNKGMRNLEFRNNIRAILREKGWTQRELARRAAMEESDVSKYVTGRKRPSSPTMLKLCAALGRPVEDVFEIVDDAA